MEVQKFNKDAFMARTSSENNDFWVEMEDVQVIEFDDHTSYTFMARRDDYLPGQFQNYVFRLYDDGTYQQHLLTYFYSHDEDGNIIMDTEQLYIQPIDGNSRLIESRCVPELVEVDMGWQCTIMNRCYGDGANGKHEVGDDQCVCLDPSNGCYPAGSTRCDYGPIYEWDWCSSSGGGATDGNDSTTSGSDTGGGSGGNGTNNDPNDTQDDPNDDQDNNTEVPFRRNIIINEIEACINDLAIIGQGDGINIETGLLASLGLTNIQLASIRTFLVEDNQCSVEAQGFALAAIDAFVEGGEVDFDDNVILSEEFENNEKLKCIYNKLAGDNSTLFRDTVGTFVNNPNANLIFTVGDCQLGGSPACTQTQYFEHTGIITIRIEDSSGSPLELAALILHEAIHAELAKYVFEFESGIDANDRPQLFQLYKFYSEMNIPNHHLDHPYMTLNYIDAIAQAIRHFDNNSYPIDYYKGFAWSGLENWDVNSQLNTPLINTYNNYISIVENNSDVCED